MVTQWQSLFRPQRGKLSAVHAAMLCLSSSQGVIAMLFCITANYTAKALNAMAENPGTDRRAALDKLVTAAGGKLVNLYFTTGDGPGAMMIVDAEAAAVAAMVSTVAATDSVRDIKMTRLWTNEEVTAIRKKRIELTKSYAPPGR